MRVRMAFKDEVNYEKISQINKKERKSSKLTTLDPEFYSLLIAHLKKLQEEYNKKYLESPTSTEALLLNNEICKLDNMIKEIYTRRERKVLLSALDTNNEPNLRIFLDHEHRLYDQITKMLNEYRDEVLNQKPKPSCDTMGSSTSKDTSTELPEPEEEPLTPEPVPEQTEMPVESEIVSDVEESEVTGEASEPEEDEEEFEEEEPDENEEEALVLVLEDIEPFRGTDLVTYNLHKEDLVSIPKSIADLLGKNNKVKIVEPNI